MLGDLIRANGESNEKCTWRVQYVWQGKRNELRNGDSEVQYPEMVWSGEMIKRIYKSRMDAVGVRGQPPLENGKTQYWNTDDRGKEGSERTGLCKDEFCGQEQVEALLLCPPT